MEYKQLLCDLFLAYYDARRNKRKTINAIAFEVDYESNLIQLAQDIWERKYVPKRSICFINFKPVQREIFAADFRDRIVHHLIFRYLNPIVEPGFIKDSYSCRKGKGTHYGIRRVHSFIRGCSNNYTKDAWILKIDILGYFMSIDRQILFDDIYRKVSNFNGENHLFKELLLYLVEQTIFIDPTQHCIVKGDASDWKGLPRSKSLFGAPKGKGFPIGNLSSQLFSNIYLNSFDHFVKEQLSIKYYGRYVDDCVLVHSDKDFLKGLILQMETFLYTKLKLKLHPKKIYFQHYKNGVSFLGAYLKPHRIYTGKRTKRNFYESIKKWNTTIKDNRQKLSKNLLAQFMACINSYLGTLQHFNTYRLRKRMIWRLHPAFFNYVYVSGGYSKLVLKVKPIKYPIY